MKKPDIEPTISGTLLEGRKDGTGIEVAKIGRRWGWSCYRGGVRFAGGLEDRLYTAVWSAHRRMRRPS